MDTTQIIEQLTPIRNRLLVHPVYKSVRNLDQLKAFMEGHIWAVWDFMSLLKGLQRQLSCVQTPWIPKGDPKIRRMINEIVFEEESDVDQQGNAASHFELYLEAMQAVGADTQAIESALAQLAEGQDIQVVLKQLDIDERIVRFLQFTFSIVETEEAHKLAAAFTFGREDVIPDMFTALVKDLNKDEETNLDKFVYYLERHIELDGGEHGPLALKMVSELCANDEKKWQDCLEVAQKALEYRLLLWDALLEDIHAFSFTNA